MYFGIYLSSTSGTTGCVKQFVTTPKEDLSFSPQVTYHCNLCGFDHGFRYSRAVVVSTPSAQRQFDQLCINNSWERDVEIN